MTHAGLEVGAFARVNAELGGRQGEDEPTAVGIDEGEAEDVAEHGPEGFRFGRIEQRVSADDGHGDLLSGVGRATEPVARNLERISRERMGDSGPNSIFISYAGKDAAELAGRLATNGVRRGREFWSQIRMQRES